jgi:hypothetical protein
MLPLPSVKPTYPIEYLNTLSPSERQAAFYGVEKRFIRFASTEYISDPQEQYNLHHFNTIHIDSFGTKTTISYDEQFKNALTLLDSGLLWSEPSGLIVINSPNYLFDGTAKEPDRGPDAFLAHLICSLAHRVVNRKAPSIDVNFLEIMQLDHAKGYQLKPNHLLIWGPITDHFGSYDCNKTVQFMFSFRNHTRILLTSTKDMGALLDKLHINVEHISYLFNLDVKKEAKTKEEVVVEIKKKRARRAKKVETNIGV